MRARRWLAVIGRAASPSETARDNIVAQVRAEVKRPKIKSLEIDSECWVGRHRRTSAGSAAGLIAWARFLVGALEVTGSKPQGKVTREPTIDPYDICRAARPA